MRKKRNHINEMSPEMLWKAAAAQRRQLKSDDYLKSITAFDYIKKLKRVQDFEDYADEIVARINAGAVNEEIPNEDNAALQQAAEKAGTTVPDTDATASVTTDTTDSETPTTSVAPLQPIDVRARKQEMKKAPAELKFQKHPNPIVNRTKDFDTFLEGDYVVVYISNLDDDVTSIWLHADSKAQAANETIRQFWDVKEIIDVQLKRNYDADAYHKRNAASDAASSDVTTPVISADDYSTTGKLADACASIVTGGEFKNITELVADIHDDETTATSGANDDMYEGQDVDGGEWGGKKSSVRLICENENYDWTKGQNSSEDFPVEIITQINPDGKDTIINAKVNARMIRKALSQGIVHIVFEKADGSERQAFATTNEEVLTDNDALPGGNSNYTSHNENQVRFYDMTIRKWRSFLMERLRMVYDETY